MTRVQHPLTPLVMRRTCDLQVSTIVYDRNGTIRMLKPVYRKGGWWVRNFGWLPIHEQQDYFGTPETFIKRNKPGNGRAYHVR